MKLPTLLALLLLPATLFAQAGKPEPGGEKRKADPSLAPMTDTPGLPRVLLIGDSISMGYTIPVRELLTGKANVHRIPQNGGSTQTGLDNFARWIGPTKWDVIHFNWGLHDLKHWANNKLDPAGPQVATADVYEKNLRELVTRLKATGAKLIWASTTPVPDGTVGRVAGDEKQYNVAAARVMKDAGIPIDDLHAAVVANPAWQREKNVHFSTEGSKALAEKVAAAITAQLPAR
jgi:acyl-CoA thioesterase-1